MHALLIQAVVSASHVTTATSSHFCRSNWRAPIRCRDRWFQHNLDIIDYYSTALSYQLNRKPTWSTCGCAAEWKAIAFRNRIIIVPRSLMILYSTTRVLEILERYPWTCLLSHTTRYSSTSSCLVSGHNLGHRPSAFSFNLLLARLVVPLLDRDAWSLQSPLLVADDPN
jgi:hypothetical protein